MVTDNWPNDLIAEYRAAYLAANAKEPPRIRYFNGWFIFEYGRIPIRYRKRAFETMRDRLRAKEPTDASN